MTHPSICPVYQLTYDSEERLRLHLADLAVRRALVVGLVFAGDLGYLKIAVVGNGESSGRGGEVHRLVGGGGLVGREEEK